jgi:hypothetical protein
LHAADAVVGGVKSHVRNRFDGVGV